MSQPEVIERLQSLYQVFDLNSLKKLPSIYSDKIEFIDPLHHLHGLPELDRYFRNMMENSTDCRFDFDSALVDGSQACLTWTMTLAHPRLNRGRAFRLDGISLLKFGQTIDYHRDYYDVSAMLHDQLPLLGPLSRGLKSRIGQ
jgi:hypothetical protein